MEKQHVKNDITDKMTCSVQSGSDNVKCFVPLDKDERLNGHDVPEPKKMCAYTIKNNDKNKEELYKACAVEVAPSANQRDQLVKASKKDSPREQANAVFKIRHERLNGKVKCSMRTRSDDVKCFAPLTEYEKQIDKNVSEADKLCMYTLKQDKLSKTCSVEISWITYLKDKLNAAKRAAEYTDEQLTKVYSFIAKVKHFVDTFPKYATQFDWGKSAFLLVCIMQIAHKYYEIQRKLRPFIHGTNEDAVLHNMLRIAYHFTQIIYNYFIVCDNQLKNILPLFVVYTSPEKWKQYFRNPNDLSDPQVQKIHDAVQLYKPHAETTNVAEFIKLMRDTVLKNQPINYNGLMLDLITLGEMIEFDPVNTPYEIGKNTIEIMIKSTKPSLKVKDPNSLYDNNPFKDAPQIVEMLQPFFPTFNAILDKGLGPLRVKPVKPTRNPASEVSESAKNLYLYCGKLLHVKQILSMSTFRLNPSNESKWPILGDLLIKLNDNPKSGEHKRFIIDLLKLQVMQQCFIDLRGKKYDAERRQLILYKYIIVSHHIAEHINKFYKVKMVKLNGDRVIIPDNDKKAQAIYFQLAFTKDETLIEKQSIFLRKGAPQVDLQYSDSTEFFKALKGDNYKIYLDDLYITEKTSNFMYDIYDFETSMVNNFAISARQTLKIVNTNVLAYSAELKKQGKESVAEQLILTSMREDAIKMIDDSGYVNNILQSVCVDADAFATVFAMHKDQFRKFHSDTSEMSGGAKPKSNQVIVLGRKRNIKRIGRRQFVMYKNKLIPLSEARIKERQLKK